MLQSQIRLVEPDFNLFGEFLFIIIIKRISFYFDFQFYL